MIFAKPSASYSAPASPTAQWTISQGWLTAQVGSEPILRQGDAMAADVMIDDAWLLAGKSPKITVTTPSGGGWLVTYEVSAGTLEDRVEPFGAMGPDAWRRTLTYTNHSAARQDLTTARLRLAPVRRPGGLIWQPDPFWMGEAGTSATAATTAVCIAYQATTDFYSHADPGTMVETAVEAAWRLAPGQSATIGSQGIWLGQPGREPFRAEAQRWYRAINLTVPPGLPDWARGMILCETGAAGHIDSRFSDTGGFAAFEHQLDALADLGVSAIWYNSVFKHKTPPNPQQGGWNHYDPINFHEVDPILGGLEGFKHLIAATRQREMHAIGEIIPWGGHSTELNALPQWWLHDRSGAVSKPWGGPSMDYSSPEWQKVMRDALAWLAHDAGIEGARIDVADGNGLNWSSPRTNQASLSGMGGSREMLMQMRDGLTSGNAQPVVIPETSMHHPEYFTIPGAMGYGFPLIFKLADLGHGDLADAAAINTILRDFFEKERGSLPDGAVLLRSLNNHDTVCDEGRVMQRFGVGLARALYGVCLCVPGAPMMYQEEETGSLDELRRMNWGRRRVPELTSGAPDYLAVPFAPEVFSVLRSTTVTCALGLVNLSGKSISGTVTLPGSLALAADARAYDAVSGRTSAITNHQFAWTLAPYETSLLRLGQLPVGEVPARRFAGEAPSTTVTPSDALQVTNDTTGVKIQAGGMQLELRGGGANWTAASQSDTTTTLTSPGGRLTLTREAGALRVALDLDRVASPGQAPRLIVRNAAEWLVSGRTALLRVRTLRRHFPFPTGSNYLWNRSMVWGGSPGGALYNNVSPSGRLWQSLLEPLHPDRPALGFSDATGHGVVVSALRSTAGNIVLTDRSDESIVDPYQLEVRFTNDDTDLAPRVRFLGLGQPWIMDSYPASPAAAAPQRLEFTLALTPADQVATALDAGRLPLANNHALLHGDGVAMIVRDTFLLPQTGLASWTNLAAVPGTYRIGLELRHSESGPAGQDLTTAYQIKVDGQIQPLEWTQFNTFNIGNAWYGWAFTPPIRLTGRTHAIDIITTHTWCGFRRAMKLLPMKETGVTTSTLME